MRNPGRAWRKAKQDLASVAQEQESNHDPENRVNVGRIPSQEFCHFSLPASVKSCCRKRLYRKINQILLLKHYGNEHRSDNEGENESHHRPDEDPAPAAKDDLK